MPSCPTCLTYLRALLASLSSRLCLLLAFLLRVLRAFIFIYTLRAFIFLRAAIFYVSYVPTFFSAYVLFLFSVSQLNGFSIDQMKFICWAHGIWTMSLQRCYNIFDVETLLQQPYYSQLWQWDYYLFTILFRRF